MQQLISDAQNRLSSKSTTREPSRPAQQASANDAATLSDATTKHKVLPKPADPYAIIEQRALEAASKQRTKRSASKKPLINYIEKNKKETNF